MSELTDGRETLSDVLLFVPSIVRDNENRKHERFFELEMDKVIYLLSGAAFLEGNIEIEKKANEEQWARFNISMPVDTFNDTYVFLIDSNEKSRVIFMDNKGECYQSFMDKGYIDKIFCQLYKELNSFYEENSETNATGRLSKCFGKYEYKLGESIMSLNEEFMQSLSAEIREHHDSLLILRECLLKFKTAGMDKDSMIKSLDEFRNDCDAKTEDILLELMDFVTGYCNPNLSIF